MNIVISADHFMTTIDFEFRTFTSDQLIQPIVSVIPYNKGQRGNELHCVVDSGADLTTISMSIGRQMGIDFSRIAPSEMTIEWQTIKQSFAHVHDYDYLPFMERLRDNNFVIQTESNCACGRENGIESFLYPIVLEIGSHKFFTLVNWIKSEIPSLLGRFGIFDKVKEVVFNKRERRGHLLLD